MEQLRGDRGWYRKISRLDTWKRLLRRRKTQARIRAAEIVKSTNGVQERARTSEGSFPRIIDLYLLRRFQSISRCSWCRSYSCSTY
jgi:hypothetical protein